MKDTDQKQEMKDIDPKHKIKDIDQKRDRPEKRSHCH